MGNSTSKTVSNKPTRSNEIIVEDIIEEEEEPLPINVNKPKPGIKQQKTTKNLKLLFFTLSQIWYLRHFFVEKLIFLSKAFKKLIYLEKINYYN